MKFWMWKPSAKQTLSPNNFLNGSNTRTKLNFFNKYMPNMNSIWPKPKTGSTGSAEPNFFSDFPPNLSGFPRNCDTIYQILPIFYKSLPNLSDFSKILPNFT